MTSTGLSDAETGARELWKQAGANGAASIYVMSQYAEYLGMYSDDMSLFDAHMNGVLTGMGYGTDVDTLDEQLDAGQPVELGYWSGLYGVFDEQGIRYDLLVTRDQATLYLPSAVLDMSDIAAAADNAQLTSTALVDGALTLSNNQFSVSLTFALPVSEEDLESTDTADKFVQPCQPSCSGSMTINSGTLAGTRTLNGKRGSYTAAGVAADGAGDPQDFWFGRYMVVDVTSAQAVKQVDMLDLQPDDQGGVVMRWGNTVQGANVQFINNSVQCNQDGDINTLFLLSFSAEITGARKFVMLVSNSGEVRNYRGDLIKPYVAPTAAPAATARTMHAVRKLAAAPAPLDTVTATATTTDTPAAQATATIDVKTLKAKGDTNVILPYGSVDPSASDKTPYALALSLAGVGTADTFTWALAATTDSTDATSRATLAPTDTQSTNGQSMQLTMDGLTTADVNKRLAIGVTLTQTNGDKPVVHGLKLLLSVVDAPAIGVDPSTIATLVIGTEYSIPFVGNGARDLFVWDATGSDLPTGLSFDTDSAELSGTVATSNDETKAYKLVLTISAQPGIIIAPFSITIPILLQRPEVASSGMPTWEMGTLAAAGAVCTMALIFGLVKGRNLIKKGITSVGDAIVKITGYGQEKLIDVSSALDVLRDRVSESGKSPLADAMREIIKDLNSKQRALDNIEEILKKPRDTWTKDDVATIEEELGLDEADSTAKIENELKQRRDNLKEIANSYVDNFTKEEKNDANKKADTTEDENTIKNLEEV